jgi:hypothetical protein
MIGELPPDDFVDTDNLGWIFAPGFLLFSFALVIGLVHLIWSLDPSRRVWQTCRLRDPEPPRAPTPKERRRIADTAQGLILIAAMTPGFMYFIPPFLVLLWVATQAWRNASELASRNLRRRERPISIEIFAYLGIGSGIAFVAFLWLGMGQIDGRLFAFSLFWVAGLVGFLAIARQFVVIRAIDLAGRPVSAEPEESHVT